jgi:hypothetical protein
MAMYYMTGDPFQAREVIRLSFPDAQALKEIDEIDGERLENKKDPLAGPYHYNSMMLILFWDLLNQRMLYRSKPWIERRAIPALAILGTIVVVYIIGKTTGTEALTTNPLYKPTFTRGAYLTSMTTYLNQLFCTQTLFTHHSTAIFLAGGLLLAAFLRLRVMAFGWLWFLVSTLPVAFIPTREAFVLYIPAVGLAISFTCLMVWLSDRVHLPIVSPASAILFIAVAGGLAFVHTGQKAIYQVELKQYPAVRQAWTQDLNKRGAWKRGDSILFLADPFPEDVWDPLFLTSLYRGDPKLTAARAKKNVMLLSPEAADLFSEIFDYRDGHLISVDKRNLPAIAAEEAKTEGYAEPQFGIYESTEAWWWTNKDFGIAARCPESKQVCKMEIRLVTPMGPFAPGEQRILGIDVDGKRQRDVPIAAQFDPISVTVDLPGGRDVAVVTHVGQEFTPDKLNGDERHLAIVVEGVHLN